MSWNSRIHHECAPSDGECVFWDPGRYFKQSVVSLLTFFVNELVQDHAVESDFRGPLLLLDNLVLRLEHPSQVLATVRTRADAPGVARVPSICRNPLEYCKKGQLKFIYDLICSKMKSGLRCELLDSRSFQIERDRIWLHVDSPDSGRERLLSGRKVWRDSCGTCRKDSLQGWVECRRDPRRDGRTCGITRGCRCHQLEGVYVHIFKLELFIASQPLILTLIFSTNLIYA